MKQLSVILVNYNVKYFLEQALRSAVRACTGLDAEIIVVDNNSEDGSVEFLRGFKAKMPAQLPLYIIENRENTGFSHANNQGIAIAQGAYILLLNPDTVVAEDTFTKCIAFMDAHPEAGGLGVKMLDGTGAFLPESKRAFPDPAVAFYKAFGLSALFPRSRLFGKYHLGFLDADKTHRVEVLAGAYMLLRRSALDKTGNLDEQYFMYGEDIDLSYRIVQAGYQNIYFADAPIIHYKGESTRKASFNYVRMFYKAMILFARKHFSGPGAGLLIAFLNMAIYLRAFMAALVRMLGKLATPLLDAALFFGGLFLVKFYWEYYVKYIEGGAYPSSYLYINVPLYIAIWLFAVFLSGGYDRNATGSRIVRGMVWGTIAIAAVYGFLPEHLRFSRGMIIAGAAVNSALILGVRGAVQLFRYGNLRYGAIPEKKMLLVGSTAEAERTHQLLHQLQLGHQVIGYVNPTPEINTHPYLLGTIDQLETLITTYKANELIFCAQDIPHAVIIAKMEALCGTCDFKIVQPGSNAIIGSNSRDTAGDIYTMDVHLRLAQPHYLRSKRILDITLTLILLLLSPIIIWFVKKKGGFLLHCLRVFFGRKTWVAYTKGAEQSNGNQPLPPLKPGVLHPLSGSRQSIMQPHILYRVNYMYARDYSVSTDLGLIRRNFKLLGNK